MGNIAVGTDAYAASELSLMKVQDAVKSLYES